MVLAFSGDVQICGSSSSPLWSSSSSHPRHDGLPSGFFNTARDISQYHFWIRRSELLQPGAFKFHADGKIDSGTAQGCHFALVWVRRCGESAGPTHHSPELYRPDAFNKVFFGRMLTVTLSRSLSCCAGVVAQPVNSIRKRLARKILR